MTYRILTPQYPYFRTWLIAALLGTGGLCGRPLNDCGANPYSHPASHPGGAENSSGKDYHCDVPPETVASLQEEVSFSSADSDIYFPPKDGITIPRSCEATTTLMKALLLERELVEQLQGVLRCGRIIAVKKLASHREGNSICGTTSKHCQAIWICYHQGSNLLLYDYGVVLLELVTGKAPVQPLEQGGDLVSWVRQYIRNHSLTSGILDNRLNLQNKAIVSHMLTVLKIALLCTNLSPFDRPSMREVVLMLIESNVAFGLMQRKKKCFK
ncbi:hypothetical protein F8388_026641, partial [Cannabis sativa]